MQLISHTSATCQLQVFVLEAALQSLCIAIWVGQGCSPLHPATSPLGVSHLNQPSSFVAALLRTWQVSLFGLRDFRWEIQAGLEGCTEHYPMRPGQVDTQLPNTLDRTPGVGSQTQRRLVVMLQQARFVTEWCGGAGGNRIQWSRRKLQVRPLPVLINPLSWMF